MCVCCVCVHAYVMFVCFRKGVVVRYSQSQSMQSACMHVHMYLTLFMQDRVYLVRLIKMCVSLRTSAKQIQIISGRNKLSSYLTLSFSCRFVMLKKKWLQPPKKEAAPQDPSRLEHFACNFCRQRTPVASRATQRRPGAEINTPLRWGIVTEYQKLLGDRSRVLPGGLKSLQSLFPWKNQVQQTRHPETRAESTCIAPSSLC